MSHRTTGNGSTNCIQTNITDDASSEEFEPKFYFIIATVLVVFFIVGCNIMFYFVNRYFIENKVGMAD